MVHIKNVRGFVYQLYSNKAVKKRENGDQEESAGMNRIQNNFNMPLCDFDTVNNSTCWFEVF